MTEMSKFKKTGKAVEHGGTAVCLAVILLFSASAPALAWFLQKVFIPSDNTDTSVTSAVSSLPAPLPQFIIDPGHGGEDGGCVGTDGTTEKDINLAVSLSIADILRLFGCDVMLTRTDDVMLYDRTSDYHGQKKVQDLAARLNCARQNPNAFFVSIHMNSYPSPKECGLQVWYSKNDPRSEGLAAAVQSAAREYLMPQNTRKIKPAGSGIYLLDRAVTPAVLIECGFLSNPEECARLCIGEYQKKLALTIAAACLAGAGNKAID